MNEELNIETTRNDENEVTVVMDAITDRSQVINRLQEIVSDISLANKTELEHLKQGFYKLLHTEQEAKKADHVANGGNIEEYVSEKDELEEQYKQLMKIIKEKRAAQQEALEIIRKENLKKKYELLDRFNALIEKASTENVPFNEVKAIQKEWKEIKEIPADKVNELWKSYQQCSEKFYDIQKLNNEFREYDFKKNLETKLAICEEAEKLTEAKDIVAAFRKLQKLHIEFRETGPIAKELREEIWTRFKSASTTINRRHQQHFEQLKQTEQEHLDQKVVICELLESIDYDSLTKFQDWNDKTLEVQTLQKKWREIGFAPQKQNKKIYDRYKSACDKFFKMKSEFFKQAKTDMGDNLTKKNALCQEVEELCNTTDWERATDRINAILKEWREIGPIHKKQSNQLWDRFTEACNKFYKAREKGSSIKSEEHENLFRKKSILSKLKSYNPSKIGEDVKEAIQELIDEWNSIGHVPYRVKDKLTTEFNELFQALSEKLDLQKKSRKQNVQHNNRPAKDSSLSIKEKLTRQYENLKNEIQTYENNLAAISTSSKTGNGFIDSIKENIASLKKEAEEILNKIRGLDKEDSAE
jgi:hypothetical protein